MAHQADELQESRVIRAFAAHPTVHVCLCEAHEHLDFRLAGPYVVEDVEGNEIMKTAPAPPLWRVRVETATPATVQFGVVVGEYPDREAADASAAEWKEKFPGPVECVATGTVLRLKSKREYSTVRWRVVVGRWDTRGTAKDRATTLDSAEHGKIYTFRDQAATGQLEVFDHTYECSAAVDHLVRFRPLTAKSQLSLRCTERRGAPNDADTGELIITGPLEFAFSDSGTLRGICELPLENYLLALGHDLLDPMAPPQTLRAQTVALRSDCLALFGLQHPDEPYDFCATDHCHNFTGEPKNAQKSIQAAFKATRGRVLMYEDEICQTPQHVVCGGHTVDFNDPHAGGKKPYLRGVFCTPDHAVSGFGSSLARESVARKWIAARPPVLCNLDGEDVPIAYRDGRRHFRWVVQFQRRQLETLLTATGGESIGVLYDIIPTARDRAGRVQALEMLGARRNLTVSGAEFVHKLLAKLELPSTCFCVDTEMGNDGMPVGFVFRGAGWGHGMGLCQMGAVKLAAMGEKWQGILQHYYHETRLTTVY